MIIVVAIALAGVIAWVSVSLSGAFAVQQVTVTGVMHLTASEVADLAAVPVGSTLMRVDAGAIEGRLESNAWIQDAHVNRIFPDTLELAITEREVGAVVELTSTSTQQTEKWAISRDGIWLMFIPEEGSSEAGKVSQQIYIDAENVLHIADVPYGVNPKAGAYCTDDSVLNAMSIINQLSTELADQIVWVSATDRANTVLTLDNGIEIAFGSDDDVRSKERVCLQLMKEHPGKISYINVRVVDRPTWRRLY